MGLKGVMGFKRVKGLMVGVCGLGGLKGLRLRGLG